MSNFILFKDLIFWLNQLHLNLKSFISQSIYCILLKILRSFWTREFIRWNVDHGGKIVLWYCQHATNLAKATVFVVCMSSARMLVWVRGRVEQKRSLTFYVFGQIRSKCSSSVVIVYHTKVLKTLIFVCACYII